MTITAPVDVELQHDGLDNDGIQIIDDDIMIIPDVAAAALATSPEREPLLPFLVLGTISLIATFVVAMLLAL